VTSIGRKEQQTTCADRQKSQAYMQSTTPPRTTDHQFGFRQKHATIEQVHRVTNAITEALENHKYCTAEFLDISQAFDKVWHEGLICKLRPLFPASIHRLLRSYLEHRYFLIKYREAYTPLHPVLSGVPQGSVLGPLLYLLYTADLPTTADSTTATFADDTVVLTAHENPVIATHRLQLHLHEIQLWVNKWRMKANETKSAQVTFTLTLRSLTLYIYGAPILDVSRSHTTTQHSR